MDKIKKGDIVGRKSYNKDIFFIVDKIIKCNDKPSIALLKGIDIRIEADSYIDDLELIDEKDIIHNEENYNKRFRERIQKHEKYLSSREKLKRNNKLIYTGRILHLDGDRRYSEKSNVFYRKMGLKAFVKNIPERQQANVVPKLIERYNPDILVITRT